MLEISPFKMLCFNFEKIKTPERVVCPPYDVISPDMQQQLYASSPYNAVRLELPREENRYEIARDRMHSWKKEGILCYDKEPSFLVYHQTFRLSDDTELKRRGILGRCRLTPFSEGMVLPHEQTLSRAKKDRLSLFKTTKTNISPIFSIYADASLEIDDMMEHEIEKREPFIDFSYQGVYNQVWKVFDKRIIKNVALFFRNKHIHIADGHHRYETAISYKNYVYELEKHKFNPEGNYNYIMMVLANMKDEGMVSLPTHRVVYNLHGFDENSFLEAMKKDFSLQPVESVEVLVASLKELGQYAIGMVFKSKLYVTKLLHPIENVMEGNVNNELKKLDVTLLHKVILEKKMKISKKAQEAQSNLMYVKSLEDAVEKVYREEGQVAFILNPIKMDDMVSVSKAGSLMPQKSTFFYPKVLTGIAFYDIS